ncbi:MAG TPA: Ppx/GppA family phosphatase [Gammaproteobacteria bacterium]|nr:Ppx/GppA family phosphatase [Gammaproteobacteria bacterium]
MYAKGSLAAVVDTGSNAIRLHLCGLDAAGELNLVQYRREAVRLGQDAFTLGHLTESTMQRTVEAFKSFRTIIDRYPVRVIRATATSALRDAHNANDLVAKVLHATGIEIEVITGAEEARLIHTAIRQHLPKLDNMTVLLIDIGGGSVEVTLSDHGDIIALKSFKMGTVRLLELFRSAPGDQEFTSLLKEYTEAMQQQIRNEISGIEISCCVGTGGNIESLGELGVSLLGNPSTRSISYNDIKKLGKILGDLRLDERIEQLQLRPDRADVIIPAVQVLKSVMKLARPADLIIPDTGLADGILVELLHERGLDSVALERQAMAWANALARKFHADMAHAKQVRWLVSVLFTQTKKLHRLDNRYKLLLEIAALTHESGMAILPTGHHKHAFYLLSASPMIGLSNNEKMLVASVVRYHRKRFPDSEHDPFKQLSSSAQACAFTMIVLLRLAIALDKERKGHVHKVRLATSKNGWYLDAQGEGDLLLEAWAARKQAIWFEQVMSTSLTIEFGTSSR